MKIKWTQSLQKSLDQTFSDLGKLKLILQKNLKTKKSSDRAVRCKA